MTSTLICSINGCKKVAACLCHHCNNNVCFKHLAEHQAEINDQLLPFADRLNQLKMMLQMKDDRNGTLTMLKKWRDQKYREIDEEYNQKVLEFEAKISKQNMQVSKTIQRIEQFIKEGEISYEEVQQLKKDIERMENHINQLMRMEETRTSFEDISARSDLVNTFIRMGNLTYLIKGRIICQNVDFYALECEKSLRLYDGLCPQCENAHVPLKPNQGLYVSSEDIHKCVTNMTEK